MATDKHLLVCEIWNFRLSIPTDSFRRGMWHRLTGRVAADGLQESIPSWTT